MMTFEEARNSKEITPAWLVWIHFDAFFDIPEKDFYFSSTENIDFPVNGTEQVFKGKIMRDIPKGRHQKDRGNDYCEFSFLNDGNSTYQDFLAYQSIIPQGRVTIFYCLNLALDYYEGETRFVGYLKDFTLDESDKSLKFTAFSDMSRTGFPIGAVILTRERCRAEFNFGGTFPPDAYRLCTWQTIQGGNPDNCTKFLKGVDSCVAHGNAHQFAAVPALSTAEISFVPSDNVDFPYNNYPCFTERNYICDTNWNIYPISYAHEGQIIKGRDLFTGEIVDTEILEVQTHIVDDYAKASFDKGTLYPTVNHLFRIRQFAVFQPIGARVGKFVLGSDSAKKDASNRLKALETVNERATVYNLRTKCNTFIVTDENASFFFDVHNNKASLPIGL